MGQGLKMFSSSELPDKWPKVAETMTEALKIYANRQLKQWDDAFKQDLQHNDSN